MHPLLFRLRHDRLSNLCLEDNSIVRHAITRFVNGEPLDNLPAQALAYLLPLKFLPCSERPVESKHAAVKTNMSGKLRKRSPVSVSLHSGRMRELELRLAQDANLLPQLMTCMQRVRTGKDQMFAFGLQHHPSFQCHLGSVDYVRPSDYETLVTEVFYHCDPPQMYIDTSEVGKDLRNLAQLRQRAMTKLRRREAQAHSEVASFPWQALLLEHVSTAVKRHGVGFVLSFPAGSGALSSLPQILRTSVGSMPPTIRVAASAPHSLLTPDDGEADLGEDPADEISSRFTHQVGHLERHMFW